MAITSQYWSTKELNELLMPTLPQNTGAKQVRGPYAASRFPLIPEVEVCSATSRGRVIFRNRTKVLHCAVKVFKPQV